MSVQQVPAVATARDPKAARSWIAVGIAVLVLLLVGLLTLSHLLVKMGNSREGQALLAGTVSPGETISGDLVLTNRGLLPIAYSLDPQEPDGGRLPQKLQLTVQRVDDGAYLYQGPLQPTPTLDTLYPGQASRLKVSITSLDARQAAAIPLSLTYYWPAHPAPPWWWWLPVLLFCSLLLGYGFYWRGRRAP
jgi:hypothetical protein